MSEYESLAKTVLRKTVRLKQKENVIIECWNHGLPIATEFVFQARAMGARPMLLFEDEDTYWRSVTGLPEAKLGKVGSHEWKALSEADAYVFIPGPADLGRIREVGEKYDAAIGYNDEWYRRARRARVRGARIGLGYVTPQRAAIYGFDLAPWRAMMLAASAVEPAQLMRRGRKLRRLLAGRGRVEVTAPNGTNFTCDLAGRAPLLEDGAVSEEDIEQGEFMANLPAGEVYVAPDERSAEGTIAFDRPVAYLGRWIRGLTFAFDDGRLAKWTATENGDVVQKLWDRAKGDRDRVGLFDVGLNPEARTGYLHDYLAEGTVYVSVGDNEDSGGKNRTRFSLGSSLTGATVRIGGTTVVRNGQLVP